MRTVVYVHGLQGSPTGGKATTLRASGLDVRAPDGRGQVLAPRVERLLQVLREVSPGVVLVGSSYGGLASLAALAHPSVDADVVAALVLLAPALHHAEPPVADPAALRVPAGLPAVVIHGRQDAVVPIDVSRGLVARCPHVRLVEVDDDHRLSRSLDVMVAEVRSLAAEG